MSLVIGKQVVEWVAQKTNEFGNFGTDVGIGWVKNSTKEARTYCGFDTVDGGHLVAGVAYANWNGPNVECHIASDGSKTWLSRQFLWTIFDYPFNQLGCNRITACVGEGNSQSRNFVVRLGLTLETTLEAAHPSGDLYIYRMWKKDCAWISQEFSKRYATAA